MQPAVMGTTNCFNPRPREGANRRAGDARLITLRFNPRPREGANLGGFHVVHQADVSIRAPVRGRTKAGPRTAVLRFQSAPP